MIYLLHVGINVILDAYKLVAFIPEYANFLLFQGKKDKN